MHDVRVPAIGPKDARIFVLGESPGKKEVDQGEPFVGPAGGLLDNLLDAVSLERDEIYITNTVKYLPTNPKEKFFFDGKAPSKIYMDGILEVMQEVKEVRPNVVVPLGNYALWAMTQQMDITRRRGSILESSLVPGQKVIPTLHPASFLHSQQWHQFILCEWDWQRIAEESNTPSIDLPQATFITNAQPDDIEYALDRFRRAKLLSIDSEWYNPDTLAYMSFSDSPDYTIVIAPKSMHAFRAIKEICTLDVPKVMQNAMFDAVALDRVGIKVHHIAHDTMVAWNACWGDLGMKRLDVQSSVLTRWPYYKDDLEFVGAGDDRGEIYAGTDAIVTLEGMERMLSHEFLPSISGAKTAYDLSMLNLNIFIEASKKGIRADLARLKRMKAGYIKRANEGEKAISEILGWSINCRSWQQVQKAVYDDLGMGRKYKNRSTSQEILMDVAASEVDNPDIRAILTAIIRVRQDRNIVSRYVNEEVVDRDGRIRCNWNLAGTRNGRYSTTKPWWNGVALQTMPEDARAFCIADPGCIFVGWDLDQAEARHVAVFTHDYDLLDLMNSGVDIHIKLAVDFDIFNMTYEEIVEACRRDGKDKVPPRVLSKTCRHAMNYDLSWFGLKMRVNKDYLDTGVGINAALSKLLHGRYMDLHPGLESWWEEVWRALTTHHHLVNDFGRRRNFLGKMEKHAHIHKDAIAFRPQSNVADQTSIAIYEASKKMPYAQCFAHMHDGGFFQVPEDMKDDAIEVIRQEMAREVLVDKEPLIVPVSVKVGYNWKEMEGV